MTCWCPGACLIWWRAGQAKGLLEFLPALVQASPSRRPRRFDIKTRFHHDLALAAGALLNVFSGGRGLDLNLHHEAKTGVLANLFTDLDMGRGNRPWASPGAGAAGPRAAFYNLRVALETLEEPAVQPPTQQPEGQASVTFPATGAQGWFCCPWHQLPTAVPR